MRPNGTVRVLSVLGLVALVATGCDDRFGPSDWIATPDTVDLYSWNRPEYLGLPSGYDLIPGLHGHGQRVAVDNPAVTGNWDFALVEEDGEFLLMPAGVLKGLENGAGIAPLPDEAFDALTKVPGSRDLYNETESVAVVVGQAYAVRSRNYFGFAGQRCSSYGKLRPISVNQEEGILRFEVIRNPNCNDRSMVPPKKK